MTLIMTENVVRYHFYVAILKSLRFFCDASNSIVIDRQHQSPAGQYCQPIAFPDCIGKQFRIAPFFIDLLNSTVIDITIGIASFF